MPASVRTTREIRAVTAARHVGRAPTVRVHARMAEHGSTAASGRAAVIAGREVGSAVRRNRAKRRLRAALDELGVPAGTALVVRAGPEAVDAPWSQLVRDVETAVTRAVRRCL